jgi:hypothetical protein
MITSVTNLSVLRSKKQIDGRRKEVAIQFTTTREGHPTNSQERKFMRQNKRVATSYLNSLTKFVDRLTKQQSSTLAGETDVISVFATVESGRRYDKIHIGRVVKHPTKQGETKPSSEVRYFVERETGKIFGAKSSLAPNETRYFGTIYNARKWDWSGPFGVNVSDDTVTQVGGYGEVKHYVEVSNDEPAVAVQG